MFLEVVPLIRYLSAIIFRCLHLEPSFLQLFVCVVKTNVFTEYTDFLIELEHYLIWKHWKRKVSLLMHLQIRQCPRNQKDN